MRSFRNSEVQATFDQYPPKPRHRLLQLRELIFDAARELDTIGELQESLRWGEPSYVPVRRRTGTPVRLGWKASSPDEISLLVHCQTSLISDFAGTLSGPLRTDGNRRIVLNVEGDLPAGPLTLFVQAAFTYHRR